MTSIGMLFVIVCARRAGDAAHASGHTAPLAPLVSILGIVWNFAMMYSLGGENWLRLVVWLAIGQAIYFGYSRRHSHLGNPLVARK